MPAQTGKSKLFASLGDKGKKAHAKFKGDDLKVAGRPRLPAGISGVAKTVSITTGKYKTGALTGKLFFRAAAVVVEPKEFAGAQISWMEELCDTPDNKRNPPRLTFDDHYQYILGFLRGMYKVDTDTEDLDAVTDAIVEEGLMVRFDTTAGKPMNGQPPRVFENWLGPAEDHSGQVDMKAATTKDETADAEESGDEDAAETDELDLLATSASNDDEDAQKQLIKIAVKAGISEKKANAVDTWDELVAMIRAEQGDGETDDDAAGEEEFTPEKGESYKYRPIDPKTKKPAKIAHDFEVTKVDAKAETVDGKDLDTSKPIKGLAWSELMPNEE